MDFLLCGSEESFIFFAVGIEWAVGEGIENGLPFFEEKNRAVGEKSLSKALPDVFYSLLGRVQHIGLVEPVVAQLVENDFVSGKIEQMVVLFS